MAEKSPSAKSRSISPKELHDGIGQELTAVLFYSQILRQRLSAPDADPTGQLLPLVQKIEAAADKSLASARALIARASGPSSENP